MCQYVYNTLYSQIGETVAILAAGMEIGEI